MINKLVTTSKENPSLHTAIPINYGFGDNSEAIFLESINFFLKSDYELALPYVLTALDYFQKNHNNDNYLTCSSLLIKIYEQSGNFPQKIEAINYVFDLFKKATITPYLAKAYSAVGRLYFLIDDHSQALVYLLKSLEMNSLLNNSAGLAENNQYLADVYTALDDFSQALFYAKAAIKFCDQSTEMYQKAASYFTLGNVLFRLERVASANRQFQQGIHFAGAIPNPYLEIYGLYYTGKILISQNRAEDAITTLIDGSTLAVKYKTHLLSNQFNLALAQAHKLNQNYKQSTEFYEAFINQKKNFNINGISNQLRNLETAHKIEAYSQRNIQLKEEIQQRSKNQAELEVLATTDPLTGLYNRRHFFTLAEHWCDHANDVPMHISAMMIDIDHFKKVNDKYGHPAGDYVLEQITKAIQKSLRTDDILCRYGGEEFGLLLPNSSLHAANQVAERIRKTIADLEINYQDEIIHVTISIGIADLENSPKHSVMGLLGHADQALYTAKHKGRNRTAIFSNPKQKNPGESHIQKQSKS